MPDDLQPFQSPPTEQASLLSVSVRYTVEHGAGWSAAVWPIAKQYNRFRENNVDVR